MTPDDSRETRRSSRRAQRRRSRAGETQHTEDVGDLSINPSAAADAPPAASLRSDSPVSSSITSPPQSGIVYRHASWLDFHPEGGSATRVYGGLGCYSSGSSPYLWATIEAPAGALVRDVEWYVYNNSGSTLTALARLWVAGTGTLFNTLVDTAIPSGSNLVKVRSAVPPAARGPFPPGVKVGLGLNTAGGGTVQINGARVGFAGGAGAVGLLARTVKVYDSRSDGGRLGKGQERVVQLPRSLVPAGVSGVLLNVTAIDGRKAGAVTVYSPAEERPGGATLAFPRGGPAEANALAVPCSNAGKVAVHATQRVHVRLDLIGTVG